MAGCGSHLVDVIAVPFDVRAGKQGELVGVSQKPTRSIACCSTWLMVSPARAQMMIMMMPRLATVTVTSTQPRVAPTSSFRKIEKP